MKFKCYHQEIYSIFFALYVAKHLILFNSKKNDELSLYHE